LDLEIDTETSQGDPVRGGQAREGRDQFH
jgi:hypothetical protein